MISNVKEGWSRADKGIFGDGLTVDPNVTVGKNYNVPMGLTGMAEHGAYWFDNRVLSNLRNDLQ